MQSASDGDRQHCPVWHALSADDVLARVGSRASGLASAEAGERLEAFGPNELRSGRRVGPWRIFLAQFGSLIVWILFAAALVSAVVGEAVDAVAILAIVLINGFIGFHQEYGAEKSLAALKKMTAPQAKVLRDGRVVVVPAAKVALGDILALEAGDLVAADARVLDAAALACVESALTGESEAVRKRAGCLSAGDMPLGDRANMVFMGTSVATGTGRAVVVGIGMGTELGRIAELIETGREDGTPLQKKLDAFGRVLIRITLGIVALLFGLGLLRGTEPLELFLGAVSLAVAAVPEGLPAVVTVSLALGVARMARRRALVRSLPAVETLGAATVICTDKTGTLTAGEMTVRLMHVAGRCYEVTGEGYEPGGEVLVAGGRPETGHAADLRALASVLLGCNNAHLVEEDGVWGVVGDPTEAALLVAALKAGGDREGLEAAMPGAAEFPFDSERKCGSRVRRMPDGRLRAFVNGAPDVLLAKCTHIYASDGVRPMGDEDRKHVVDQNAAMAGQSLRVLGSAWRDLDGPPEELTAEDVERDLVFVGLSGMYDPPRAEAREAVARCRAAGIRVVMITGDHPRTARAIAREIGIATDEGETGREALTGVELDAMDDDTLVRRVEGFSVYSRVTAEHKLRIIHAWKTRGAVVAMTGDGVNDAPAVKGADIGIAMGRSGTEVTKEASDMVVTDDNFASIVAAVEEGRGIYDNIRKTLQYLLAGNSGELLLMAACVVIGLPVPLLPIHLLWINLVTDGLPALCLATDPIDPEVMKRRPRPQAEAITDRGFLTSMLATGLLTAGAAFAAYFLALPAGTDIARGHAFTVLVFAELLRSFGVRSETRPVWRMSFFSNRSLVLVVALSMALQVLSQHNAALGRFLKMPPVSPGECLTLLAMGAIPLCVLELAKLARSGLGERK
jgi:Ca2+-transporting ATPase